MCAAARSTRRRWADVLATIRLLYFFAPDRLMGARPIDRCRYK
jgi:hypothetical protein